MSCVSKIERMVVHLSLMTSNEETFYDSFNAVGRLSIVFVILTLASDFVFPREFDPELDAELNAEFDPELGVKPIPSPK